MAEWYYRSGSRTLGPCSFEQLIELALTNSILPDTPISSDGKKWKRARAFPALWKLAMPTSQPADAASPSDTMAAPSPSRRIPTEKPLGRAVRYQALAWLARAYRILGLLNGVLFAFGAVAIFLSGRFEEVTAIVYAAILLMAGVFQVILLYATGEGILLAIDVEANMRRSAEAMEELAGRAKKSK